MEPTFDQKGYPSTKTLEYIEGFKGDREELYQFVVSAWNTNFGSVQVNQYKKRTTYRFWTGGWSGNEDLINSLNANSDAAKGWLASLKGGVQVFEVKHAI